MIDSTLRACHLVREVFREKLREGEEKVINNSTVPWNKQNCLQIMCEIQILSRRDTKALAPHTQHCDALQNITQNNGVSVFENMLQK